MPESSNRPLRVFLCHSSNDKPAVRELYKKLTTLGIDAWLDEKKLLGGQNWKTEIPKAVRAADAVIVLLSKSSITKEGCVQTELRFALDIAQEKHQDTNYLIPVKLVECEVPESLRDLHWVNLYKRGGFNLLLQSLHSRADFLGLKIGQSVARAFSPMPASLTSGQAPLTGPSPSQTYAAPTVVRHAIPHYENKITLSNGMEFMRVPASPFLMGSTKENLLASDHERPRHAVNIPAHL